MEQITLTLTDFLLARIAEDEAVAKAASDDLLDVGGSISVSDNPWPSEIAFADQVRPARVLAECESKRRIVEDCDELLTKDVEYNERFGRASLARGFLSALALPYATHPDYRDDWKP